MTDPRKFKAPFNPRERIWQEADKLRTAPPAGPFDWLAADETSLDYIATRTAPNFGASAEVIAKRLQLRNHAHRNWLIQNSPRQRAAALWPWRVHDMSDEYEIISKADVLEEKAGPPPPLPSNLLKDERYFTLIATALRTCLHYKPKFGKGRKEGLTL